MLDLSLCVITCPSTRVPGRGFVEIARAALAGGARVIQLRAKGETARTLWEVGRTILPLTREREAALIVNDHLDIAMAVDADGVHLGEDDLPLAAARRLAGPAALIGASVANPEEARQAEADGATYVSVGSIYATASKPDAGDAIGLAPIGDIKRAVAVPVLAIGGITCDNVSAVIRAGADGVAVISAVTDAEDMAAATTDLLRLIADARRGSNRE